ncbi:MAG: hypothetical protein ACRDHV_08895 [Actinomycetota bacterium]
MREEERRADIHVMGALARATIVALAALVQFSTFQIVLAGERRALPPDRPTRGLVFEGLRPARPGGPCDAGGGESLLEIRGEGALLGCTHGPDPAPPEVEMEAPSTSELREMAVTTGSGVPCIGDGSSGFRVQAIYAYPADRTDRYEEVAPLIEGWASSNVDAIFAASAAATGGGRLVRFLTDAACRLEIARVQISAYGAKTFSGTISELRALGFGRSDRKYLVWMDAAGPYCGIAQQYADDTAGSTNRNDGSPSIPGMVARIDAPCWGGLGTPIEAHELMHTLGGVQSSAPNASGTGHCTDEADAMCYDDGSGTGTVASICPGLHERLFDCQHDDYFHTAPPAGSYLATHWNAAASRFLEAVPFVDDGQGKTVTLKASRKRVRPGTKVRFSASVGPCDGTTGGMVLLRSKGRMWARPVGETCAATFKVRVPGRTRFRAVSPAQGDDAAKAVSQQVTVRTTRG